ncbi:response regulator transcription factor [Olivibacter sitiensis]|uniref:response regulator transcription factor n=1 Tax=Olivibacter sitiensis TaxID=376470 RepID=UPI00048102DB|nr:helix-turn-helix transcriptional regulator [Olivibacter sitiensis]
MTVKINRDENQQLISRRETEIVRMMSLGYNSRQIGKMLFISEQTVQTHRRNVIKRLGLRNSNHLIAWAFQVNMLSF